MSGKSTLILKLDGLGDWIIFEYYLNQIKSNLKNTDLLVDSGCFEYVLSSELKAFVNHVASINFRGNFIHSFFRRNESFSYVENFIVKRKLRELAKTYDMVIVSVWNAKLAAFIKRYFINNIDAKHVYFPTNIEKGMFRGESERLFLESTLSVPLKSLTYKKNPIGKPKKIFIFAGSFKKNKRWPENLYIELAEYLIRKKYTVSVWGLPRKYKNSKQFIKFGNIHDILGSLKESDIYLGNDTGFMHSAIQMHKRVIVIDNGITPNNFLNYKGDKLDIIESPNGSISSISLKEVIVFLEKIIQ